MRARAWWATLALTASLVACTGGRATPEAGDASGTPRPEQGTPPAKPTTTAAPARPDEPSVTDGRSAPEQRPARPPRRTTVTVVGDIMLGRGVAAVATADGGSPNAPLRPMRRRLARADITVGNLESTLSRAGRPRQGDDSFAARPVVLDGLAAAGFDVLSLANNHTGDFGRRALLRTLRRVRQSPIRQVGAGRDGTAAWRPVVLRRNGVRFGFVAFNAIGETPRARPGTPGAAEVRMQPRTGPLDEGDLRRATRVVRRLDRGRADVVVVLPHWGEQYTHVPVPDQRRVGRALVRAGANAVVGGHPHWVQRVQRHRGAPVIHSLGNFVFDMDFMRQTQEGVVADLRFVGDRLRSVRFTPYVMGADFAPRVVRGPRAEQVLEALRVPRRMRLSGARG